MFQIYDDVPNANLQTVVDEFGFVTEAEAWNFNDQGVVFLTQWGGVTHICVTKLTIVGSDNGLSPGQGQAIIYSNAVILLVGLVRAYSSEILVLNNIFPLKKCIWKYCQEISSLFISASMC